MLKICLIFGIYEPHDAYNLYACKITCIMEDVTTCMVLICKSMLAVQTSKAHIPCIKSTRSTRISDSV